MGSASTDIAIGEEMVAFYFELGLAITQWAHVEIMLKELICVCFETPEDRKLTATGYFAIENFRSKLQFVDRIVQDKYGNGAKTKAWSKVFERLGNISPLRNRLAHNWVMVFPDAKPGRRYALRPWFANQPSIKQLGNKPPPGSLCLRDINKIRFEFTALFVSLVNLQKTFLDAPKRHPEPDEQPKNPQTIQMLKNQIHAMLGHQQKSSREKRRELDAANAEASLNHPIPEGKDNE